MKIFEITKLNDTEIERVEVTNPSPEKLELKAKEIAQYNERQANLHKRGLIKNPKVKLLIT